MYIIGAQGAGFAVAVDASTPGPHGSAQVMRCLRLWAALRPARAQQSGSAVKHRPADVVPQPLVVKDELANRLRELVTLPPALESPCGLAFAFRCARTCGLDRIGGRTEFVRG